MNANAVIQFPDIEPLVLEPCEVNWSGLRRIITWHWNHGSGTSSGWWVDPFTDEVVAAVYEAALRDVVLGSLKEEGAHVQITHWGEGRKVTATLHHCIVPGSDQERQFNDSVLRPRSHVYSDPQDYPSLLHFWRAMVRDLYLGPWAKEEAS